MKDLDLIREEFCLQFFSQKKGKQHPKKDGIEEEWAIPLVRLTQALRVHRRRAWRF